MDTDVLTSHDVAYTIITKKERAAEVRFERAKRKKVKAMKKKKKSRLRDTEEGRTRSDGSHITTKVRGLTFRDYASERVSKPLRGGGNYEREIIPSVMYPWPAYNQWPKTPDFLDSAGRHYLISDGLDAADELASSKNKPWNVDEPADVGKMHLLYCKLPWGGGKDPLMHIPMYGDSFMIVHIDSWKTFRILVYSTDETSSNKGTSATGRVMATVLEMVGIATPILANKLKVFL